MMKTMKWVVLVPQPNFAFSNGSTKTGTWPPQPSIELTASFFPLHKSLEEEINRLFSTSCNIQNLWGHNKNDSADVMEEFRHNGKDTEYLTDEEEAPKPVPSKRRKSKKPLPTECVFCKNNGEIANFYRSHILKDAEGKVVCPVLRNYECPICKAKGDNAHTLKYCPASPKPQTTAVVNLMKGLRNATGKRRSKYAKTI